VRPACDTWSCSMAEAFLSQASMTIMMEIVLPFRRSQYISGLCEKLLGEGIAAPADLLLFGIEDLESKLSTDASFSLMEMIDAIRLRKFMDDVAKKASQKPAHWRSPQRGRSRTPPSRGRHSSNFSGGRGWKRDERPRSAQRGRSRSPPCRDRQCDGSRAHQGRGRDDFEPLQRFRGDAPALWAGVEKRGAVGVQDLCAGKDPAVPIATSRGTSSTRPPILSATSRRLLVAKAKGILQWVRGRMPIARGCWVLRVSVGLTVKWRDIVMNTQ
jgi:hypothetical protein